jgi:hypothetical protein
MISEKNQYPLGLPIQTSEFMGFEKIGFYECEFDVTRFDKPCPIPFRDLDETKPLCWVKPGKWIGKCNSVDLQLFSE